MLYNAACSVAVLFSTFLFYRFFISLLKVVVVLVVVSFFFFFVFCLTAETREDGTAYGTRAV